jgi:methionyl-tRNA synthetase
LGKGEIPDYLGFPSNSTITGRLSSRIYQYFSRPKNYVKRGVFFSPWWSISDRRIFIVLILKNCLYYNKGDMDYLLQNLIQNPVFVFLILVWTLPWKGVALWRAAKNDHKGWFVALLVLNTLGMLEILYIFVFSKKKSVKNKA